MQTINKRQAFNLIKSIMLGDPDKRAESVYVTDIYSDDPKPECVIGVVLDQLGGRPQDLSGYASWITKSSYVGEPANYQSLLNDAGLGDVRLTPAAAHLFALAQSVQDGTVDRFNAEAGTNYANFEQAGLHFMFQPSWGEAFDFLVKSVPAFKR